MRGIIASSGGILITDPAVAETLSFAMDALIAQEKRTADRKERAFTKKGQIADAMQVVTEAAEVQLYHKRIGELLYGYAASGFRLFTPTIPPTVLVAAALRIALTDLDTWHIAIDTTLERANGAWPDVADARDTLHRAHEDARRHILKELMRYTTVAHERPYMQYDTLKQVMPDEGTPQV